ncbi:hypothetical protein F383_37574 [Gossypium arboreum]|uniref:Uncharacterized protein n=1 Tax=Gossypium arboreum TaxID=29729 RepID=A0A0B0MG79_GOSAR|nr:hypothetical protein F383_37574 [Gossypium arboreum]
MGPHRKSTQLGLSHTGVSHGPGLMHDLHGYTTCPCLFNSLGYRLE